MKKIEVSFVEEDKGNLSKEQKSQVYCIEGKDGKPLYIGETERSIDERMTEHFDNGDFKKDECDKIFTSPVSHKDDREAVEKILISRNITKYNKKGTKSKPDCYDEYKVSVENENFCINSRSSDDNDDK